MASLRQHGLMTTQAWLGTREERGHFGVCLELGRRRGSYWRASMSYRTQWYEATVEAITRETSKWEVMEVLLVLVRHQKKRGKRRRRRRKRLPPALNERGLAVGYRVADGLVIHDGQWDGKLRLAHPELDRRLGFRRSLKSLIVPLGTGIGGEPS